MSIRPEIPTTPAEPIKLLEAGKRARDYCTQLLAADQLMTNVSMKPDPKIAAFFDGWRFAYDFFLYEYRIRQTVLILFVNKVGKVEVEWNDLARLNQSALLNPADSPSPGALAAAMSETTKTFPEAQIESVEVVWNPQWQDGVCKGLVRCWRLGLVQGMERRAVTYTTTTVAVSEARTNYSTARPRFNTRWQLGDSAVIFQERAEQTQIQQRLMVNLDKLNKPPDKRYTDYWIIWSCIARAEHFVEELGYTEVGLRNTYIELVEEETHNADHHSGSSDRGRLPVITVTRNSSWARDVTIITHELGHAFYWLMFVRPPRMIDSDAYPISLKGIEEGFADYFAAAILINNTPIVRIGAYVIAVDPDAHPDLPRVIEATPHQPKVQEAHEIGWQWANFLWDVRLSLIKQLDVQTANRIIFDAHLRPQVEQDSPSEPLACYFHALQRTTWARGVDLDWQELASRHSISVLPMIRGRGMAPQSLTA